MESSSLEDHSRTIIHIDLDCFYAQVEMIKNPQLKEVPLGIQQKNIVVTTNYIARRYGVNKCELVTEAVQLCPNLVLVNGEDLHDYRKKSYEVTELLQTYSNLVERLGLDENYIDVSNLVDERLKNTGNINTETVGHIFGDASDFCDCGCKLRLQIGSVIAQEMRDKIKSELLLTSSAGISYNKLLAKIAGGVNKPDQQTVVFPNNSVELMLSLSSVSKIPGIGVTLAGQLNSIGIMTIKELQNSNTSTLNDLLGSEKTKLIHDLSFGIDNAVVKASGKPLSIGIEDSCRVISAENEVKEKLEQLLNRLIILLSEDGRLPRTLKLTVRKYDKSKERSNRETRQCNISPSLFNINKKNISEGSLTKIMTTIMHLFKKLVDTNKPYHLTLLGLSFTKFFEKPNTKNLLTQFIKKNIEVQSITDIESNFTGDTSTTEVPTSLSISLDNDLEPSIKKRKYSNENIDSPSDLPVAELHLCSETIPQVTTEETLTGPSKCDENCSSEKDDSLCKIACPPNIDTSVFQQLPKDLQQELWEDYKRNREREDNIRVKKFKSNSILNYFNKH